MPDSWACHFVIHHDRFWGHSRLQASVLPGQHRTVAIFPSEWDAQRGAHTLLGSCQALRGNMPLEAQGTTSRRAEGPK